MAWPGVSSSAPISMAPGLTSQGCIEPGTTISVNTFTNKEQLRVSVPDGISFCYGGTARLYEGVVQQPHRPYKVALKVIPVMNEVLQKLICRELKAITRLHLASQPAPQHVLPFIGTATWGFYTIIVSELMRNGNMLQYLKKAPTANRQHLLIQVARAVCWLHDSEGLVHGDLKCENVLIDDECNAVLADFGLATLIEKEESSVTTTTGIRMMHTLRFAAPELLFDVQQPEANLPNDGARVRPRSKTTKSDVYAFGMLIVQAFTGTHPWPGLPHQAIYGKIYSREVHPRPPDDTTLLGLSDAWWSVCLKCWKFEAGERPAMKIVLRELVATRYKQRRLLDPPPTDVCADVFMRRENPMALNQHPSEWTSYSIGISDDKGVRRTMEDAYSFVVDFAGVRGQGFFAIFDGHWGNYAAEWCGQHFHEHFLEALAANRTESIRDVLNKTFNAVDRHLAKIEQEFNTYSGCTAVTAFLRLEDAQGGQSFLSSPDDSSNTLPSGVKSLVSSIRHSVSPSTRERAVSPPLYSELRRVLYIANAGDTRAVLCRAGKAVRLTYDHRCDDRQEAKRIMDAGGFVMNNRVNGVLAVTRALGDSSMKEFVVGAPYTTETELGEEDEFLIIACDGLWDVAEDQQAVDLVRGTPDAQEASAKLLKHAMANFSTDNVTVLVVRLDHGRERR